MSPKNSTLKFLLRKWKIVFIFCLRLDITKRVFFSSEIWGWVDDVGNVDRAEWFFDDLVSEGPEVFIMPMKTGNAYEFAIVRASWPGGLPDVITFNRSGTIIPITVDLNESKDEK